MHVSLGLAPAFPTEFRGLKWEVGAEMVLFAPTENRSPVVESAIPVHWLQAGVKTAEVEVAPHFSDPNGDPLSYSAVSSDGRTWWPPGSRAGC